MFQMLYEAVSEIDADAAFISAVFISPEQQYEVGICDRLKKEQRCYNSISISQFCGIPLKDNMREAYIATQDAGGIWTGLYKKNIIVNNNIYFPKKLKFEDNYWVSLLRCYLDKINFVNEVGYCYRYNPEGSSKRRNCDYYDDRTEIENCLLKTVRERGLYQKYYDAWEYLYANRYGINTCLAYITRFDKIPYEKIDNLRRNVEREFPKWRENKYFSKKIKEKLRISIFEASKGRLRQSILYKIMQVYYNKKIVWHD